jgi:hypothetical protein
MEIQAAGVLGADEIREEIPSARSDPLSASKTNPTAAPGVVDGALEAAPSMVSGDKIAKPT